MKQSLVWPAGTPENDSSYGLAPCSSARVDCWRMIHTSIAGWPLAWTIRISAAAIEPNASRPSPQRLRATSMAAISSTPASMPSAVATRNSRPSSTLPLGGHPHWGIRAISSAATIEALDGTRGTSRSAVSVPSTRQPTTMTEMLKFVLMVE